MTIEQVKSLIKRATIVIIDGTRYRVDYCEDEYFHATDEEDSDQVTIEYDEIDLARDKIFGLVQLNT